MRPLPVRLAAALSIIVLLLLVNFVLLNRFVSTSSQDNLYINWAGKQRMYSQRIQLMLWNSYSKDGSANMERLKTTLDDFKDKHKRILKYLSDVSATEWQKLNINPQFQLELDVRFERYVEQLEEAIDYTRLTDKKPAPELFRTGSEFLRVMDQTVKNIERHSSKKIAGVRTLFVGFFIVLILVVTGLSLFFVRPKFQMLRSTLNKTIDQLNELKRNHGEMASKEKLASIGTLTSGFSRKVLVPLEQIKSANRKLASLAKTDLAEGLPKLETLLNTQGHLDTFSGLISKLKLIEPLSDEISEGELQAQSIVSSITLHARPSTGTDKPTDINQLVLAALNNSLETRGKTGKTEIQTAISILPLTKAKLNVYKEEISLAFSHIFNNAVEAINERFLAQQNASTYTPMITTQLQDEGDQVRVTIWDNGVGIPKTIQHKVFEPYFSAKPEETGLGLTMAEDLIRLHRGDIKVTSKEGEYTQVEIVIPRSDQPEERV